VGDERQDLAPQVRAVGGKPSFVAAHGIAGSGAELSFEQAYALTRLVLEHGGGPVPFKGKQAVITKATVVVLTHAGLVEVEGSSEFTQRVYVRLTVDGRISELLDVKYAGIIVKPLSAREKAQWLAVATQAGFDLVAKHLP
jgi:hypothetical protein